jgi:hypothetical protein
MRDPDHLRGQVSMQDKQAEPGQACSGDSFASPKDCVLPCHIPFLRRSYSLYSLVERGMANQQEALNGFVRGALLPPDG